MASCNHSAVVCFDEVDVEEPAKRANDVMTHRGAETLLGPLIEEAFGRAVRPFLRAVLT